MPPSSPGSNIGLVIPTLNAGNLWDMCLEAITSQSLKPHRILVVDSSSTDDTCEKAQAVGFEVSRIERSQFNHGGTRREAAERLDDCEIILFLTQDAIPAAADSFEQIVRCFEDPSVAVAYGRQIPHRGATAIEAHARYFNYGETSVNKNAAMAALIGAKVFFCSNSFSAYRRSTFLDLGGFAHDLILGEDMEFAAKALKAGFVNAYCARATVRHSHDYTIAQTFARYFDLGVFDARTPWPRQLYGSHGGEGLRFVASEFKFLMREAPRQILRAALQNSAKLLGYRLGRAERRLPHELKRRLSSMPGYWRSTR